MPALFEVEETRLPYEAPFHSLCEKRSLPPKRGESCMIGADGLGGREGPPCFKTRHLNSMSAPARKLNVPIDISTTMTVGRCKELLGDTVGEELESVAGIEELVEAAIQTVLVILRLRRNGASEVKASMLSMLIVVALGVEVS